LNAPARELTETLANANGGLNREFLNLIAGIRNVVEHFAPGQQVKVRAITNGKPVEFDALVRIDTPQEALYYSNGGMLNLDTHAITPTGGLTARAAAEMSAASVRNRGSDVPKTRGPSS